MSVEERRWSVREAHCLMARNEEIICKSRDARFYFFGDNQSLFCRCSSACFARLAQSSCMLAGVVYPGADTSSGFEPGKILVGIEQLVE